MSSIVVNLDAIYKRRGALKDMIKPVKVKPTKVKHAIIVSLNDPIDSKYKACNKFSTPYFIIVGQQDKELSEIKSAFVDLKNGMSTGMAWSILPHYVDKATHSITGSSTLNNLSTFFKNKGYQSVADKYIIRCDNDPTLYDQIYQEKNWRINPVRIEEFDDGSFHYKIEDGLALFAITTPIHVNLPKIVSSVDIHTIKWFLNEKKRDIFSKATYNLEKNGNAIDAKKPSMIKNSLYKVQNTTLLGSGWNAYVLCCLKDNGQDYVIKLPKSNPDAWMSIYIEYMVYLDLKKIKFPVLDIHDVGHNYEYILRKKVDPLSFGDKIPKISFKQRGLLREIFRLANRYAVITGVPLDLKPDNLWWDGDRWLLVDTGPRLDVGSNFYVFTLNPKNFQEYYKVFWLDKGDENALPYQIYKTHEHHNIYEIKEVATNKIVQTFSADTVDHSTIDIDKLIPNAEKFFIKALSETELNRFIDNIKLLKYPPYLDNTTSILENLGEDTSEYTAIKKLIDDSYLFWNSLSAAEQDAIDKYTGTYFRKINECLRKSLGELDDKYCDPYIKELTKILMGVFKNPGAPRVTGTSITVYRTLNVFPDYDPFSIYPKMSVGDLDEDRGFKSTSIKFGTFTVADPSKCLIHKIIVPVGTICLYAGDNSAFPNEKELVIGPGAGLELITGKEKVRQVDMMHDKIKYKTDGSTWDAYTFTCEYCSPDDLFKLSPAPIDFKMDNRMLPQQQDTKVGKNRLHLQHLSYYNKAIERHSNDRLRLMTWNVFEWKSLLNKENGDKIREIIRELRPDVIGLQEVTISGKNYNPTKHNLYINELNTVQLKNTMLKVSQICKADYTLYNLIAFNPLSIVGLYGNKLSLESKKDADHPNKRCATWSKFTYKNNPFYVIVLHLDVHSQKKRIENMKEVESLISKLNNNNIIVMGDFNSYRADDYDHKQMKKLKSIKGNYGWPKIFEAINMLEKKGFVDGFVKAGQPHPINTNKFGGRIDFIYISSGWNIGNKIKAYTRFGDASDHLPIIIDFLDN